MFKKLIPTIAMLLVSMIMLSTATFAWFSMNNRVTVTGMTITASVGSNLLLANSTITATTKEAESAFTSSLIQTTAAAKLEPVSTIDGVNFYYTINAAANGDALEDRYTAYNPADTSDFNLTYGSTGAVAYTDYVFQLKAVNTEDNPQYINFNKINLVYNGTDILALPTFRVAIFYDKFAEAFAALPTVGGYDSTTLLNGALSANQTATKAVNSTTTLADVTYAPAMVGITVAANSIEYYKVVVRLWIEGEDIACTSGVFAELNNFWALDLDIALERDRNVGTTPNSGEKTGTKITNVKYSLVAANYTPVSDDAVTIATIDYNVVPNLLFNGEQIYTTSVADTALTTAAKLFVVRDGVAVEVTNLYGLE